MSKLRLGTIGWEQENAERICIFNANYGPNGAKTGNRRYPWVVQHGDRRLGGTGFPSHEDATDWLRESLVVGGPAS